MSAAKRAANRQRGRGRNVQGRFMAQLGQSGTLPTPPSLPSTVDVAWPPECCLAAGMILFSAARWRIDERSVRTGPGVGDTDATPRTTPACAERRSS
jgi:hypothetical protein